LDEAVVAVRQPGGEDAADEAAGGFALTDGGIEVARFGEGEDSVNARLIFADGDL
jgi:hypothetical protein